MPTIDDRFRWEPDAQAKNAWLGTRKRKFKIGNQTLPGFYQTADFDKDLGWATIALFVEGMAVGLTLYGGILKGGNYLWGSLGTVLFFLLLDYIGTKLIHMNAEKYCRIKSLKQIESNPAIVVDLQNELERINWYKIFGIILIIFSALVKIGAIFVLGTFKFQFMIVMVLLYIVVVYIHIDHTRYVLAEFKIRRKIRKQHMIWAHDTNLAQTNSVQASNIRYKLTDPAPQSEILSEVNLDITNPVLAGSHSISFMGNRTENGKNYYCYLIETNGILLDDDITLLANAKSDNKAGIIALACLKHQVNH